LGDRVVAGEPQSVRSKKMSWSIDVVGTKSAVLKKVTEHLDKAAASYEGKEEGKDIVAVKERILAIVEAMEVSDDPEERAVFVKANGSHTLMSDNKIVVANLAMRVGRTAMPR
jgi:hypothetical protein